MPGCVKEIMPTRMTLNSGLRNHRVKRDTGFEACTSWAGPSSGCFTMSVDMTAAFFAGADVLLQDWEVETIDRIRHSIVCFI